MTTPVVVTGLGLSCALGQLPQAWELLIQGKSGVRSHQPFADLPRLPLGLIGSSPSRYQSLVRRVIHDAIQDARWCLPLSDWGVVIGSSRSTQRDWEQLATQYTQHNNGSECVNWLDLFPHQGAVIAATELQTMGPVLAPMAACATGIVAIAQGYELIATGQCERVLVGAVEAPVTPLTIAGFLRLKALAKTGLYPFDGDREGFVLGEGGAALVLESVNSARRRGRTPYGQILGFGLSCDAHHLSAPDPNGYSALRAIKDCLERSGLQSQDINYIHAHGTGTTLNDQREAQLIQALFPRHVAVSSTKAATGHTLGASGTLGAVFSLLALKHQQLPPCLGLRETTFDLNFVKPSEANADSQPIKQVLNFSFGFGGQNAVLALGAVATASKR